MSILTSDIKSLHQQLVNKEVTAVELVKQAFDQIEATDESLGAFISLNKDQALARAEEIDAEGVQEGDYLKGIPMALKDNVNVEGQIMTGASRSLENYTSIYDATITEKLRQAGAILIGKTNLDEFAMGSTTESSYFHKTANPWDTSKMPGGSSGGSAVAVASGQVSYAIGTDTGGSIRMPASYTNLTGLKPSYGLVSRFGLIACASSLDTVGSFTQTVEDNAIVTQVIAGHDEREMTSLQEEVPDYLANLDKGVEGLKIGVIEEFSDDDRIREEVRHILNQAIDTLVDAGAEVKTVSIPHAEYAGDLYQIIQRGESTSLVERFDGIRFGYRSDDYEDLESLYVNSRTEGLGTEVKKRTVEGLYITSAARKEDYYFQAGRVRTLLKEDMIKALGEVDVIIAPISADAAHNLGEDRRSELSAIEDSLTAMVNLTGVPSLTLPAGFVDHLPVGMQILGKHQDEATLFQVGQAFQKATDFHTAHPELNGGNN